MEIWHHIVPCLNQGVTNYKLSKNFKFTISIVANKIVWKQADFCWKLPESSLKNSPKADSPKALRKQDDIECSTKAEWLLLSALRKQDDFRWELYESQMTFVECSCSTKARWLSLGALRKQDDFRWELYESRMTFIGSSTKAFQKDFVWVMSQPPPRPPWNYSKMIIGFSEYIFF